MNQYIECPYCRHRNAKKETHEKDMSLYGKAVICCDNCDRLHTLRDDGDGEYVRGEQGS